MFPKPAPAYSEIESRQNTPVVFSGLEATKSFTGLSAIPSAIK